MKLLLPFFKRKGLLNRKQYWTSIIICWVYTVSWIIILFSIWYFWDAGLWYKLIVNFILILFTPALSDLFKTYEKYKIEWEEKYSKRDADDVNENRGIRK